MSYYIYCAALLGSQDNSTMKQYPSQPHYTQTDVVRPCQSWNLIMLQHSDVLQNKPK